MARISTHVLDTALGRPARDLRVELFRGLGASRLLVSKAVTNTDGRTEKPLLAEDRIEPGVYEMVFQTGTYLRSVHAPLPEPLFLDEVVIRFGVAEPEGNYHVPLLLSPWAYSTYRGS